MAVFEAVYNKCMFSTLSNSKKIEFLIQCQIHSHTPLVLSMRVIIGSSLSFS